MLEYVERYMLVGEKRYIKMANCKDVCIAVKSIKPPNTQKASNRLEK